MVWGEQAAGEAESDDRAGGGDGAEDEEHDHGLDHDGVDGVDAGEDEAGHGAGQEDQPDGFGGFDLGGQCGAQGGGQVGPRGFCRGLAEREAGFDFGPLFDGLYEYWRRELLTGREPA